MKNYNISIIKGDGIGPEIVDEAIKVLNAAAKKCDFELNYKEYLIEQQIYDDIYQYKSTDNITIKMLSTIVLNKNPSEKQAKQKAQIDRVITDKATKSMIQKQPMRILQPHKKGSRLIM